MVRFIDEHRKVYGVGPICATLPIAPLAYYEQKRRQADPERAPFRVRRDAALREEIQRVWDENLKVYGARKVWRQLNQESITVARYTVERLMLAMELKGVVRGKRIITTDADTKATRPLDLVNREFRASAPIQLWAADFTYLATWKGLVYVAFVIDVFARMIVGWRVSASMNTDLTLDALEQALWARRVKSGLVYHRDRCSMTLMELRWPIRKKIANLAGHKLPPPTLESIALACQLQRDHSGNDGQGSGELAALGQIVAGLHKKSRTMTFGTIPLLILSYSWVIITSAPFRSAERYP
jgi:hypothetical protein